MVLSITAGWYPIRSASSDLPAPGGHFIRPFLLCPTFSLSLTFGFGTSPLSFFISPASVSSGLVKLLEWIAECGTLILFIAVSLTSGAPRLLCGGSGSGIGTGAREHVACVGAARRNLSDDLQIGIHSQNVVSGFCVLFLKYRECTSSSLAILTTLPVHVCRNSYMYRYMYMYM